MQQVILAHIMEVKLKLIYAALTVPYRNKDCEWCGGVRVEGGLVMVETVTGGDVQPLH